MEIDPRGPRFGALITMVMFAIVLITGNVWVLTVQTVVFACGALLGLRYSPYGLIYSRVVRPATPRASGRSGWSPPPSA